MSIETEFNKRKAATNSADQKLALAKQTLREAQKVDPNNPDLEQKVQQAQIAYNQAFQAENDYANSVAQNYSQDFEGGPGEGGRAYMKRRERGAGQRAPAPLSQPQLQPRGRKVATAKMISQYMEKYGVNEQQAIKDAQDDGYEIQ
jgi:hypothetical protein